MDTLDTSGATAMEVGSCFTQQYYSLLEKSPDYVHRFYDDPSKMLFVDGNSTKAATSVAEIHSLIISMNITGIEIKTINALGSWGKGVLVTVSGLVKTQDYNDRRKFIQTFFLAPQETGYFIFTDIFHLFDEEEMHQHPEIAVANCNYESNLIASNSILNSESVTGRDFAVFGEEVQAKDCVLEEEVRAREYVLEEEVQAMDFVLPIQSEKYETIDKYSIPELPQQTFDLPRQNSKSEEKIDERHVEEPIVSFPAAMDMTRDPPLASTEEPISELTIQTDGEPSKLTYASILQSGNPIPKAASLITTFPVALDRNGATHSVSRLYRSSLPSGPKKSSSEVAKENSTLQDEGVVKSIYVGNLPISVTAFDIENEFKKFGIIKPNGVALRSRKDLSGNYAFIEFEDVNGVQNALKVSPMRLNGQKIYVEARRPNSSTNTSRGGTGERGGAGSGYRSEVPRGQFGGRTRGQMEDSIRANKGRRGTSNATPSQTPELDESSGQV